MRKYSYAETNFLMGLYVAALFVFLLCIMPGCRTINKTTSSTDSTSVKSSSTTTVFKRDTVTIDNNTIEYVFQTDTIHKNDTVWLFKDRIVSNRPIKSIKQSVNRLQSGSRSDSSVIVSNDSTKVFNHNSNNFVKSPGTWWHLLVWPIAILLLIFVIGERLNILGWFIDKIAKLLTRTR